MACHEDLKQLQLALYGSFQTDIGLIDNSEPSIDFGDAFHKQGCGGQKADQHLFLRSSGSPVVMVKTPNDRISNDPYPRTFSRSRDMMIVVVKVPGTTTLPPAIIQDLPDALLGNAKHLGQCRYRLTLLVSRADFSIAFAFGRSAIGDGELREF